MFLKLILFVSLSSNAVTYAQPISDSGKAKISDQEAKNEILKQIKRTTYYIEKNRPPLKAIFREEYINNAQCLLGQISTYKLTTEEESVVAKLSSILSTPKF